MAVGILAVMFIIGLVVGKMSTSRR